MIELVLVMAMMAIMLAVVFVNYKTGAEQLALQRAANKLMGDIRRAETMAGVDSCSYGISFNAKPNQNNKAYILFADCGGNEKYEQSETKETIELEKGIEVCSISGSSGNQDKADLLFMPPDPFVFVDGVRKDNILGFISLDIVICQSSDTSKTKAVSVNRAGMISSQ